MLHGDGGSVAMSGLWFYSSLDSIIELLKIAFPNPSKYIFHSDIQRDTQDLLSILNMFSISNLAKDSQRCDLNLPTGILVENNTAQTTTHTQPNSARTKRRSGRRAVRSPLALRKTHLIIHPTSPPTPGRAGRMGDNQTSTKSCQLFHFQYPKTSSISHWER